MRGVGVGDEGAQGGGGFEMLLGRLERRGWGELRGWFVEEGWGKGGIKEGWRVWGGGAVGGGGVVRRGGGKEFVMEVVAEVGVELAVGWVVVVKVRVGVLAGGVVGVVTVAGVAVIERGLRWFSFKWRAVWWRVVSWGHDGVAVVVKCGGGNGWGRWVAKAALEGGLGGGVVGRGLRVVVRGVVAAGGAGEFGRGGGVGGLWGFRVGDSFRRGLLVVGVPGPAWRARWGDLGVGINGDGGGWGHLARGGGGGGAVAFGKGRGACCCGGGGGGGGGRRSGGGEGGVGDGGGGGM